MFWAAVDTQGGIVDTLLIVEYAIHAGLNTDWKQIDILSQLLN